MSNRTKVTESHLSCLQSIGGGFIDRDCPPQTQAVTDHGIEPRRLLAILLARPMCDRCAVNVHYHSTKTGVITPYQLHFYGIKEAAALDGVTIIYGRHLQITSAIYSSGAL